MADRGILISALVAVVAIVGLVLLLKGGAAGGVTYISGELGPDRGVPRSEFQSFRGNDRCVFVGTGVCTSGILCTTVQYGTEYCA